MEVKLPNLGEGAESGTVVAILVKAGSVVVKGQNVIELETGKAVAPIPSPAAGMVGRVAVKEGDKISVGQLILVLEIGPEVGGGDSVVTAAAPAAKAGAGIEGSPLSRAVAASGTIPVVQALAAVRPAAALTGVVAGVGLTGSDAGELDYVEEILSENPAAGPYVRRLARDLGIDLRVIPGSGKSGQVTVGDVREYVARLRVAALRPRLAGARLETGGSGGVTSVPSVVGRAAAVSIDFSQWGPVTRKPMSQLRRVIAERMVDSATSLPTVTQFDDADVAEVNELRKRHMAAYEAKGARLTLTSFVMKAVASTLRKHPLFNASIDDATLEIVLKDYVHLGLAVDTEAGLLVPVLRDADRKDLLQLSREVQELAAKARERKLALTEMQGGTFTISNQGGIGSGHFTPVINRPEVAILGLGRSVEKPVVRDGQVVARLMMPVTVSYDHRLIDGGAAARFMVDLVAAMAGFRDEDVKL